MDNIFLTKNYQSGDSIKDSTHVPYNMSTDTDWVLDFKVFDTETSEYIRNETKKSFEELPLRGIEKKYREKCVSMNWIEPRYVVTLNINSPNSCKK